MTRAAAVGPDVVVTHDGDRLFAYAATARGDRGRAREARARRWRATASQVELSL